MSDQHILMMVLRTSINENLFKYICDTKRKTNFNMIEMFTVVGLYLKTLTALLFLFTDKWNVIFQVFQVEALMVKL